MTRSKHFKVEFTTHPISTNFCEAFSKNEKRDFLHQTVKIWQPQADHLLSDEDARQIAENIVGFFRILQEWDKNELNKKS